ncbi:hypothetical protein V496_10415 [Pseudogymnoascus sp. VKM F-4515 (FW-2607)]|nr:hypothetical protein V496_10415 [Pseudogymnoascus sp. VKM F-4515 (FW-2607)]KFY93083.1 hypothetical protein V498_04574 [Pseudogymnoascus sp. VKM F-4517 (FW-2822)]
MSSTVASTGSPTSRRTFTSRSQSQENTGFDDEKPQMRSDPTNMLKKSTSALSSSKLVNQVPKKAKMNHDHTPFNELNPMDRLLAKLSEQQATINKQHEVLQTGDDVYRTHVSSGVEYATASATSSLSVTPATNSAEGTVSGNNTDAVDTIEEKHTPQPNKDEVLRLKIELEKAKGKIARMDQELTQTRITKHTIEQAIGSNSEADFPMDQLNASGRSVYLPDGTWIGQDDTHSDNSDALSAGGFNRASGIWGNSGRAALTNFQGGMQDLQPASGFPGNPWGARAFNVPYSDASVGFGQTVPGFRSDRLVPDNDGSIGLAGDRRNANRGRFMNRTPGAFQYAGSNSSYDGITPTTSYGSVAGLGGGATGSIGGSIGLNTGGALNYQAQPIGSPLSPFAPEFNSLNGQWKNDNTIAVEGQTFLPTTEPLNYRRLLDRTVNCNWKYIVDKIVCNNDQQASIFLQQKLKVGTTEQKYDIVEAIVAQAYPLMINRFGNFLVQRCFEHGTPEQVIKIAEAIRGNTLNLSMDAFGCHVVQKAFDSVPEDYKAIMVHELLRRIPETVIHRYACHVWQKLFELRWTESPPQIMKFVNEALRGMWHEVALGETGSLVVQNIFENCLEEDKRPCIEEVLASIDIVAHGQFGNWCIQHICEHGAPVDRSRAIDHVIRYASEYSMDQFASKVVEKCLKIGGVEFLGRYLDRVCEGRNDRPRIPLIDIASDQYGNYLIQYILTHSNPQHREIVACHIRKHMVSLRGSKFGSRVGMLCTNPAIATRPGPGVGPALGANRMPQGNPRFGGAYR